MFQEVVSHLGKLSHDRRAFYDAAFCKGVSFVEVVKDPKGECSGGHDLAMGAIGKDGFSDNLLKTRRLPANTHAKLVADAAFSRKIAVNEKSARSEVADLVNVSFWRNKLLGIREEVENLLVLLERDVVPNFQHLGSLSPFDELKSQPRLRLPSLLILNGLEVCNLEPALTHLGA